MKYKLPIPSQRAIRKLGQDIRNARLRRRISTELMAERAGISRATLYKIESGDSAVTLQNYVRVLFILGKINELANLMDAGKDTLGLDLEEERLPKRIRHKKESDNE